MVDVIFDVSVRSMFALHWRRKLTVASARMVAEVARSEGRRDLEVTLRLTDDATIHELNRDYRSKNKPTDVLAFAQREGFSPTGHSPTMSVLGDIVISLPTARRQTTSPKTPRRIYDEVLFLASHGLCHLIGYDHRSDAEETLGWQSCCWQPFKVRSRKTKSQLENTNWLVRQNATVERLLTCSCGAQGSGHTSQQARCKRRACAY
jgi:rRNA maturation RNase YbeY